jgi:hypothetical protein
MSLEGFDPKFEYFPDDNIGWPCGEQAAIASHAR